MWHRTVINTTQYFKRSMSLARGQFHLLVLDLPCLAWNPSFWGHFRSILGLNLALLLPQDRTGDVFLVHRIFGRWEREAVATIHHFPYKIHYFQYKIHLFKCKNQSLLREITLHNVYALTERDCFCVNFVFKMMNFAIQCRDPAAQLPGGDSWPRHSGEKSKWPYKVILQRAVVDLVLTKWCFSTAPFNAIWWASERPRGVWGSDGLLRKPIKSHWMAIFLLKKHHFPGEILHSFCIFNGKIRSPSLLRNYIHACTSKKDHGFQS